MRRFVLLLLAVAAATLASICSASAASAVQPPARAALVHIYHYDDPDGAVAGASAPTQRDPPAIAYGYVALRLAADVAPYGPPARPQPGLAWSDTTYDHAARPVGSGSDTTRGASDGGAAQVRAPRTRSAAKSAIGLAGDVVGSAYQGIRSGGGHAIRHLRDEGSISDSGRLASQVSPLEKLTSPILRSPSSIFDWRLGNTLTRGFAGEAGGQQVVVFLAKEGTCQGRVLSAVVPDVNRMARWGLL